MPRRGCGCCNDTCELFNIGANTDPTGLGFSTDYGDPYPTSASGLVIPANSYLQWDTALPATGVRIATNGTLFSAPYYNQLDPGIELAIYDDVPQEVVVVRKIATDTVRILTDFGFSSVDLQMIDDNFGTSGSTILGSYSAFHELLFTQLSAQIRRYHDKDPFFFYGTTFNWEDDSGRIRVTGREFALSNRSVADLGTNGYARIINTTGSDVTVEFWRADKVRDTIEPLHLSCEEKRQVCLLVNDNHVQQWSLDTAGFTWEGLSLRSVATKRSTNCAYYEESDYGTIGEVPPDYQAATGNVEQDYYVDRYSYTYRLYEKYVTSDTIAYNAPDDPLVLDSSYTMQVTPKAHPSDSTKLLLDVTVSFLAPGLIYDGTPPVPSNVSITAPGATITATVTSSKSGDTAYIPSLLSTGTGATGQSKLGQCWSTDLEPDADPGYGGTITHYRTQSWVSTERKNYRWSEVAGLYWVDVLQISLQWTDVEVTKWGGSSPTLNLSSADATILVNDSLLSSIGSDNVYIYQSGSTSLDSSSTPFDWDGYTPLTLNPYGASDGDLVAGSGSCPTATGSFAVSFEVVTDANFKRVNWSGISVTITGST